MHPLSEIIPFIVSVFAHWQIWLSGGGLGGFILIVMAVREKLWDKPLSKKQYAYLFLIAFFLCSCFLSWVDKDDALSHSKEALSAQAFSSRKELNTEIDKFNTLQSSCQYQAGVVDTLGKQNRDQQNSINNCQTQALKLLTPQALKITSLIFSENAVNGEQVISYLLLANKDISPVELTVECNEPFKLPITGPTIVGIGMHGGGGAMRTETKGDVTLVSPAWTPTNPLRVDIIYAGVRPISCRFDQK